MFSDEANAKAVDHSAKCSRSDFAEMNCGPRSVGFCSYSCDGVCCTEKQCESCRFDQKMLVVIFT